MALKVLTALDHAKTQYYHFKAIVIAGMGLFSDAYDLFSIVPVMKIIGRVYYPEHEGKPGVTPPAIISTVVATALVGTVVGQLVFGVLGDRVGRRKVFGLSLLIMILGSVASGFSICRTRKCMLTSLCFFRFWVGVGVGGDYPLSATIMSEFANKATRGSFVAAVFSMQGFGILACSGVTMTLAKAFDRATKDSTIGPLRTPEGADMLWRLVLMIGAVPATLTFYWRMGMPETARFTALVENDVVRANNDMGTVLGDPELYTLDEEDSQILPYPPTEAYGFFSRRFFREHGRNLFGCAASWLIVDIPFYSSTLFQSKIYEQYFKPAEHVNVYEEAFNVAKFQTILAIASTIPGYWFTVYFIDRIGRRKIQMMGFFLMAVFLFVLAGPYDAHWAHQTDGWFMVLYGLTFFFSNFGPNTTTFIVPAELFPARLRSTCHGVSGAFGKVGAIVGAVGFLWAAPSRDRLGRLEKGWNPGIGMMNALIVLGGVCIVGLGVTYFFTPETNGRSLEENEGREGRGGSEEGGHANGELELL